jgi:hypothetical protein
MAVIQAVLALVSRSLGKIVAALFGWAGGVVRSDEPYARRSSSRSSWAEPLPGLSCCWGWRGPESPRLS